MLQEVIMVHRTFIRSFAVIGAIASIVYSANALAAPPVKGFYDLELYVSEFPYPLQPLPEPATLLVCDPSNPPCQHLLLRARVEDGSHLPAQGGAVVFESCYLKGNPPGSDAAPSAACESGLGMWMGRWHWDIVDGFSPMIEPPIGVSFVPRTVGYRFSYIGQGTSILNYASEPKDVTWISAP
jgi:hypothetical protein